MDLIRIREHNSAVSLKENCTEAKKMSQKCFLETEGYRVSFDLKDVQVSKECVDMVVEFTLDQHLGGIVVQSVPTFIAASDLHRLATYFEEHMAQLLLNPDSESSTFVPLELGFQAQALGGEVYAENDGEFSVRFLLNVGRSKDEGERVYVGGESVVTLKNIRKFIASLHETLADWPHTDSVKGLGPSGEPPTGVSRAKNQGRM